MIIKRSSAPIVCDVCGCNNKADFFIKSTENESDFYSVKLCKSCAVQIKNLLVKELKKKESESEN